MSFTFWLVSMFLLGLGAFGLCYLFMEACEKI